MKKIILAFSIAVCVLSSCKKDYVCTCNTSVTVGNSTVTGSTPYVIPNATKQEATTICIGHEVYQQGNSQTTTCSL